MLMLRDVMTPDPVSVAPETAVIEVARLMRDDDIGDVLVVDGERLVGVVTDRDIVIRGVADGVDPNDALVRDVMTVDLTVLPPDATVDDAADVMRERAVRRIPIVDGERVVGVVTIGDLAIEQDGDEEIGDTLADVSAAPPNS
jgi:CBS domain-containing protein